MAMNVTEVYMGWIWDKKIESVSALLSRSINDDKNRGRSRRKDMTLIAMLAPVVITSIQLTIGGVSRSHCLAMVTPI